MMNGRMMNEMKIDAKTEMILDGVPDYVKGWYVNLKASDLTASTRREYVKTVKRFLESIDKDATHVAADKINEYTVNTYFASLSVKEGAQMTSDSYRATSWACLKNFFEYLRHRRLIQENYMDYIKKPKVRDLDRINEHRVHLTGEDLKNLIGEVKKDKSEIFRVRNEAIIKLFIYTGMRKSALINIMIDDVDMTTATVIVIDKGKKRHQYILNADLRSAIANWMWIRESFAKGKNDNHLFLSDRGCRISETAIDTIVHKYTKAAIGKPLSPHKLRAGFCSVLYEQTGDIEFVRRAVGHSSAATTQRYIVTNGDERKRASEIIGNLI